MGSPSNSVEDTFGIQTYQALQTMQHRPRALVVVTERTVHGHRTFHYSLADAQEAKTGEWALFRCTMEQVKRDIVSRTLRETKHA